MPNEPISTSVCLTSTLSWYTHHAREIWEFSKNIILYLERSRHFALSKHNKNTHLLLVRCHACANPHSLWGDFMKPKRSKCQKTSLNKYHRWRMCFGKKKNKTIVHDKRWVKGFWRINFRPMWKIQLFMGYDKTTLPRLLRVPLMFLFGRENYR